MLMAFANLFGPGTNMSAEIHAFLDGISLAIVPSY